MDAPQQSLLHTSPAHTLSLQELRPKFISSIYSNLYYYLFIMVELALQVVRKTAGRGVTCRLPWELGSVCFV